MIIFNKTKFIKGLTHSQFYRLANALNEKEISFDAFVNKKDLKKFDIRVSACDVTSVLVLISKIKTIEKE